MDIKLPVDVDFIIKRLQKNSHSAYAVGGCVRDSLLGKVPTDWDICTDAFPDETLEIFKEFKALKTGIKHGTVTLIINSVPYEITTFRADGNYLDSRRPESVKFLRSLKEDAKRRDFTVNAMAYCNESGLLDYFGGLNDISKKTIRCVGNPTKRFSEDALRIMRAVRFSAVLGFEIDDETKKAVFSLKDTLLNIAPERINTEFTKILLCGNPQIFSEYARLFSLFFPGFENSDCNFSKTLVKLPKSADIRLAFILLKSNSDVASIRKLRYSKKTITAVSDIINNYSFICNGITDVRNLICATGYDTAKAILTIKDCESNSDRLCGYYKEIKENNLCCRLSELDISGEDIKNIGISDGNSIGNILKRLLSLVISGRCENKKEKLTAEARLLSEELK